MGSGDLMAVSGVTTIVAQVTYPVVVNGYLCFSAEDVKAARKYVNPRSADERSEAAEASSATTATSSTTSAAAAREADEARPERVASTYTENATRDSKWPRKDEERGQYIDIVV
jgi:hypothetical protein